MPKKINKESGLEVRKDGAFFQRVFYRGKEYSRLFQTKGAARAWKAKLLTELSRCPEGVQFQNKKDCWKTTLDTPDGVFEYSSKDLNQVIAWKTKNENALKAGTWVDPNLVEMTLGNFVEIWRKRKVNLTGKTWAGYNSSLTKHISRIFDKKLMKLSSSDIRNWIGELVDDDIKPAAVNHAFRLLRSILNEAVYEDKIVKNPAIRINLPTIVSREMRALDEREFERLYNSIDERFKLLILFAKETGARFGEITAIKVSDINPLRKQVTIQRAISSDATGRRIEGTTKTGSTRIITIKNDLMPRIQKIIEGKSKDSYLFTGVNGKEPLNYGWFRKDIWKSAVAKADLEGFTFHGLRHTCASTLIRKGTPVNTVSYILGHSSTRMTLDVYSHYYQDDVEKWMNAAPQLGDGTEWERSGEVPLVKPSDANTA